MTIEVNRRMIYSIGDTVFFLDVDKNEFFPAKIDHFFPMFRKDNMYIEYHPESYSRQGLPVSIYDGRLSGEDYR